MRDRDTSMGSVVNNEQGWVSAAVFSHPDIYYQELEQVFGRMWLFVGHESQIPNPGDFVRSRMGEEQVIVTRGRDNKIYVLLNSCSHRGNMVCRYDFGHQLAFQCSFHGWTFGSDGRLINLPPGTQEEYGHDLRKEEWGLLQARVETFHGTIWANWDKKAPDFRDYLGGCADWLEAALSDAEGDPDGTEVAPNVMRWRVGMNWKVPMPDHDLTHGWITHRSMRGLAPVAIEDTTREDRFENDFHVWFPEGHTTSIMLPKEGASAEEVVPQRPGGDIVSRYIRERAAKRRERLGNRARIRELPHIFPNVGAVGSIFRILNPQGPDSIEMWSYVLVDKNAPSEVKEAMIVGRERISGPNGMQQKDDMENWFIQTRYSKGTMTRWGLRQNNQLGMYRPSVDGPSTYGLAGNFHSAPTDETYRRFFEHYRMVMEARDWDHLRAMQQAKSMAGVGA